MLTALPAPLLAALAAALLLPADEALADAGGSLGIDSDYRFRGVSLSDGQAAPHLHLAYDAQSGGFAGAYLSPVTLYRYSRGLQGLAYVGFAWRDAAGNSWEAGVLRAGFNRASRYGYGEAFTGMSSRRWSGRLYYSPDYFGRGVRTAYAELDGTLFEQAPWSVFGHLGALRQLAGTESGAQFDTRLGLRFVRPPWQLQLARVARNRAATLYPVDDSDERGAWVASLSWTF